MPTVNEKLKDKAIQNSIGFHRLEASIVPLLNKRMIGLKKKVIKKLLESNVWDTLRKQTIDKRLRILIKETEKIVKEEYSVISKEHAVVLLGVAKLSQKQTAKSMNVALKSEYSYKSMSDTVLKNISKETLIEGASSAEWWKRRSQAFQGTFTDTVRDGMQRGQSSDEIARTLRGTKANNYHNSAFKGNFRSSELLVRTSINAVANATKEATYDENDDIVKALEWVSTLDSKTSPICQALDGLTWTVPDHKPIGHNKSYPGVSAHWGCRSTQVAVTKSFEELGKSNKFNKIPEGTRASMDGQVSAKLNYEGWLKTKPESFQKEVLGKTKHKLWKNNDLKFTDMINQNSNPLTLEQLELIV